MFVFIHNTPIFLKKLLFNYFSAPQKDNIHSLHGGEKQMSLFNKEVLYISINVSAKSITLKQSDYLRYFIIIKYEIKLPDLGRKMNKFFRLQKWSLGYGKEMDSTSRLVCKSKFIRYALWVRDDWLSNSWTNLLPGFL